MSIVSGVCQVLVAKTLKLAVLREYSDDSLLYNLTYVL